MALEFSPGVVSAAILVQPQYVSFQRTSHRPYQPPAPPLTVPTQTQGPSSFSWTSTKPTTWLEGWPTLGTPWSSQVSPESVETARPAPVPAKRYSSVRP